jgi:hypothetical protein
MDVTSSWKGLAIVAKKYQEPTVMFEESNLPIMNQIVNASVLPLATHYKEAGTVYEGEGDCPWVEEDTWIAEGDLLRHLVFWSPTVYMNSSINTTNCHSHTITRDGKVMPADMSYSMYEQI